MVARQAPLWVDPLRVKAPRTAAEVSRKVDARAKQSGRVQWGRIYVRLDTMRDVAMLTEQWQFKNRSELVEVAVRHLAKLTRDGLERIEL